jgi:hypothetical protein
MIHVSTEVLERGLDACLCDFELPIVTERGLSLNLDLRSIAHLIRASTHRGSDKQPPAVASVGL